jgi:ubiquitin carboxyl-terminal hydrolase 25/28
MKKPGQTNAPLSDDERPTSTTEYTVATYCESCHYHFTIKSDYRLQRNGQLPCHLGDKENPLHHLRLASSLDVDGCKKKYGDNKYQNMVEAHTFVCSGTHDCPLVVEIQIRSPRILPKMLALINDTSRVWTRGQTALLKHPSRLMNLEPCLPIDALGFLRQYLLDGKSATPKRIARRNKKYMMAFADDCDAMFEYLDFVLIEEEEAEADEAEVSLV